MANLTDKIREDYGTVVRFCKLHDINVNTYKVVALGNGTSTRISNILIKHKYIKSAKELRKRRAS